MAETLHPIERSAATYVTNLAAQISDPDLALTHATQRFGFTESELLRFVRLSGLELDR